MKRKRINQRPKKTLLIVTYSEAESLYFSQMRKDCRYTNMSVMWAQDATSIEDAIKFAASARTKGKFDKTWVVFGFSDASLTPATFRDVQECAAKKKIQLAWNNPGIALWYLLHIQAPRLPISDISVLESTLKGHLSGFSTSAEYLLTGGASLHLKLFSAKAQAAGNAASYNGIASQKFGGIAPTNMTKLLNDISEFCGVADITHNQKLIGMKNA